MTWKQVEPRASRKLGRLWQRTENNNREVSMAAHYAVELTKTAQATYERIYGDAQACLDKGDESNSKVKLLRVVDEAIDILIPHDPFNPGRALQGPLSNIF